MSRYEQRRDRLRKLVKKTGAEAILVTNEVNVTYLTGFTGDSSYLLLRESGETLLSDFRYITQLEEECPRLDVIIRKAGTKMAEETAALIGKAKVSKLAFEASTMTVAAHADLSDKLPKVEFVSTSGLVEDLRAIKDKEEIEQICFALDCAEKAFGVIRASIRPDQTEKEIADQLELQVRLFGAKRTSFTPIVAVGPWAALPHATPGDRRIEEADLVLIDWGALGDLYVSDMTRVLVTGKVSAKLERVYGVVLAAQKAAIKSIRHGAIMKDVDAAARKVISDAGFGSKFGHGLGHGIGLQVHESPRMGPNEDKPLKAGMVVTVEPGIYLPGWGGVRIEDDVLVTRNGHEVLSSTPRELADAVIG